MADRTGAGDAAADAAAAAYAAGVPLSELARQLMRREEVLEMEAPGWLADQVACASRGWGVAADVGAAWMFAAGTQRLLAAERTDRLRWLTEKLCLNFAAADGSEDRRRVRADTPGGGLRVALALLAMRTGAARQDVAAVGLAWGALRLHDTSDNHDCAAVVRGRGAATGADAPAEDSARVCPHAAAVQAAVALQPSALALLDPTQTVAVSLPGWVDDWLVCIAGRWQAPPAVAVAWLLAEGAAWLYTLEARRDTAWRSGPTRWVIPTGGAAGPRRQMESPGETLRTLLGQLASSCGAGRADIVALAVAVGAKIWQDGHGCCCGPRHTPASR